MKTSSKRKISPIILLSFIIVLCTAFILSGGLKKSSSQIDTQGKCAVTFIDVGQGDSTLIQCGGKNILIDAGEADKANNVLLVLKRNKIKSLDYIIGTHFDFDHIGGIGKIINSVKTENIILSDLKDEELVSNPSYNEMLDAITKNNVNLILAKAGYIINMGEASLNILGPIKTYDTENNRSIITRLKYRHTSFLFMGDAESIVEEDLIHKYANLESTVLKLGHHGSSTSTSQAFLNSVKPTYAVASSGKNNRFGHPSVEVITRLNKMNIETFRTDLDGNITAVSDGEKVVFYKQNNKSASN